MGIANYTTSVPVGVSVGHIMKLLTKAGASTVTQEMEPGGVIVGVQFGIETEFGWRPFRLPVRIEGVHETLKRDKVPPRYRTREHAARVAWRIAHDWLRAQLALIDAGMTSLPEVMFPYVMLDANTTAYERYAMTQREVER